MAGIVGDASSTREQKRHRERPPADVIYKRSKTHDPAWESRLAHITAAARKLSSIPAPPPRIREDLTRPRHVWKEFYRQDDAFEFCRKCRMSVHVFSVEVGTNCIDLHSARCESALILTLTAFLG